MIKGLVGNASDTIAVLVVLQVMADKTGYDVDMIEEDMELEAELGLPVLSSNRVLAWHMCRLAGIAAVAAPSR